MSLQKRIVSVKIQNVAIKNKHLVIIYDIIYHCVINIIFCCIDLAPLIQIPRSALLNHRPNLD